MTFFEVHKKIIISIVSLVIVFGLIIVSFFLKEMKNPIGSVANTVVTYVSKPLSFISRHLGDGVYRFTTSSELVDENKKLKEENEDLKKKLIASELDEKELNELKDLRAFMEASATGDHHMKSANVIAFDDSNPMSIITIDIGSEKNVKKNDVVISSDGLVGRIIESGYGFSKVMTILDEVNKVGILVKSDKEYLGICKGSGNGELIGEFLDDKAVLKEKMEVYTSGIGGIYPAGLRIGNVSDVLKGKDLPFRTVSIEPYSYFYGLQKVAVLE